MTPDYLMQRAQWWEIRAVLAAIERNDRPAWERARWLSCNFFAAMGCKNKDTDEPLTPRDLVVFPWERESRAVRQAREAEEARRAEELRRSCRI